MAGAMTSAPPEMQAALQLMDEGFNRPGWHGPSLLASLRGLTHAELLFRPGEDAHNAWELALHCAYWKHTVQNRVAPGSAPLFALAGSNFFRRETVLTPVDWRKDLSLLKTTHARLRGVVIGLKLKSLDVKLPASRHTYRRTIFGIAAHDIYHAGQISLLKKLARADRAG